MNLNGKAVWVSTVIALGQSVAVTYYATNPHPTSYWDLLRIEFVMSWIISFGGVSLAAHMNFRDPKARTRENDSYVDNPVSIKEVLDKRGK